METDEKARKSLGRFGVVLPPKAIETIQSRELTLYIQQRLNWVEDGIITFIKQALSDEGRLSDYLRLTYPENLPVERRRNDTGGERKPLKFRFRYMLRSLEVVSRHYKDFVQWQFTGLEFMMEAFMEVVRQALGAEAGAKVAHFYTHFRGIWKAVNPLLWNEADVSAELKKLVDEVDELFEALLARSLEAEGMQSGLRRMEAAADALEKSADANRKASRIIAKVAGLSAARVAEAEDTSRSAGLERYNDAQKREIEIAIETSHSRYAIERSPAGRSGCTISGLAELCWRENAKDFAALAALPRAPGFTDVKSYKTALYRLARNYPAADHFRWKT